MATRWEITAQVFVSGLVLLVIIVPPWYCGGVHPVRRVSMTLKRSARLEYRTAWSGISAAASPAVFAGIMATIIWNGGGRFARVSDSAPKSRTGGRYRPHSRIDVADRGSLHGGLTSPRSGCGHPASEFTSHENTFGESSAAAWTFFRACRPSCSASRQRFFCKALGHGLFHPLGRTDLACMVLPILIRATEEGPALCSQ